MWETRPPRITKEEGANPPLAGVCEGIGARYEVDTTLVRVVFAALAFIVGGGFFLYLLCWFTMPRLSTQTSPAEAIFTPKDRLNKTELDDRSTGYLLFIALLFFFPSVTYSTDARTTLAPLFGTFAALAVWWALHQRTPEPPPKLQAHYAATLGGNRMQPGQAGQPRPPQQNTAESTAYAESSDYTQYTDDWAQPGHNYSYSAYGADHSNPKQNRPLWLWIPIALALTAIVFAAGMVVSEIRHWDWSRFGQASMHIESADLLDPIDNQIGNVTVFLTDLEPIETPTTFDVNSNVGAIEIFLPEKHGPIDVNCTVNVGDTACPKKRIESNLDGAGELLTLNLHQKVGSIRVVSEES